MIVNLRFFRFFSIFIIILCFLCGPGVAASAPDEGKAKTEDLHQHVWGIPTEQDLRNDLVQWFDAISLDPMLHAQALALWPMEEITGNPGTGNSDEKKPKAALPPTLSLVPSPELLVDKTLQTLSSVSDSVAAFLKECDVLEWNELPFGQKLQLPQLPEQFRTQDSSVNRPAPPRLSGVLRMYLVERLIRTHYYDEALELLQEMVPENTIDPIAVLFYRGVAYNKLLSKKEGLSTMKQLRESFAGTQNYSRRFFEVAKLIEHELKNQEQDEQKPQNIAKRMEDIQRRLGQGNTDEKVQEVEKGVLDSLDQLIEKLENQQKQCKPGGQGAQSNNPGDTERILRQKGPGNVAEKNIGDQNGWGELPHKEREAALMQIEKEFPAHYRDVIEQYFRQMAEGK